MWATGKGKVFIAFTVIMLFTAFIMDLQKNDGFPSSANESNTQPKQIFNQPPQALPETGSSNASFSNGVAPLKITTSGAGGDNYFVKLVNLGTQQDLAGYFIRSGDTLDIQVPIGTYEMKYATGKIWYGPAYLFGPETAYSKAESPFTFELDRGYTVELIMQQNGNLRTAGIEASQW